MQSSDCLLCQNFHLELFCFKDIYEKLKILIENKMQKI
jgi:hypothetical protein